MVNSSVWSDAAPRTEEPQLPPTPSKALSAGDESKSTSQQASTMTPVAVGGMSEAHLEHSGGHRASLGGLGADSSWGDLPAGGAGNLPRCVSVVSILMCFIIVSSLL